MKQPGKLAVVVAAVFLTRATARCPAALPACDSDNGGITLPRAFAPSWSRTSGAPRHLAVASNGDLFRSPGGRRGGAGGILALRDTSATAGLTCSRPSAAKAASGIRAREGALYLAPPPPCI